ncbi:MAG: amidohydrolase family protein [Candidatus Bipolaricaulia bacterium]
MKVDAHQHFWHYTPEAYDWIGPDMKILKQDFLPDDLAPLLASAGIEGTVAVQARQTLEETNWLLELADRYPFINGVVGWVDLRNPELRGQLERFCAHPKFRGVRHVVQDELDDRFMLREDFIQGLETLSEFDLAYDILIFPRHLPVAYELVEKFPEQRFVLDHITKPPIKDGKLMPWAADIRRLAAFPNVFCKVSGMVTEADWKAWKPDDFRPYLDVVFEAFGPRRIMFGSDWPVCTLAGTYTDVAQIVSDYVEQFSTEEQANIWGETATRFYRL